MIFAAFFSSFLFYAESFSVNWNLQSSGFEDIFKYLLREPKFASKTPISEMLREVVCPEEANLRSEISASVAGKLYVCGRTFLKGHGACFPLSKDSVDSAGHTPFPRPLVCSSSSGSALCKAFTAARFSVVKGEYFFFCAQEIVSEHSTRTSLPCLPRGGGRLWCWGSHVPLSLCEGIPESSSIVSFDVGGDTLYAVTDTGQLFVGSGKFGTSHTGGSVSLRPIDPSPPGIVSSVSASDGNVAVICDVRPSREREDGSRLDEGPQVFTFGLGIATGFSETAVSSSRARGPSWRRLQLIHAGKPRVPVQISMGSLNGAAVSSDGIAFVWGDGMSGSLGTGARLFASPDGIPISFAIPPEPPSVPVVCANDVPASTIPGGDYIVSVSCTKAQPNPKRLFIGGGDRLSSCLAGQEGPRCHAVTARGRLWICGSSHKGLAANCLYKALSPHVDALSWYRVGSDALDAPAPKASARSPRVGTSVPAARVPTGALEMAERLKCVGSNSNSIASMQQRGRGLTAARSEALTFSQQLGVASVSDIGKDGCTQYLTEPGLSIVQSSPAHIHSAALSLDGRCFMWGCGSDGRLGLRCFLDAKGAKRWMKCYVSSPSAVEAFSGRRVVAVSVFRCATCFIVADDAEDACTKTHTPLGAV